MGFRVILSKELSIFLMLSFVHIVHYITTPQNTLYTNDKK